MVDRLAKWKKRVAELEDAEKQLTAGECVEVDGNLMSPELKKGQFETDLDSVKRLLIKARRRVSDLSKKVAVIVNQDVDSEINGVELRADAVTFANKNDITQDELLLIIEGVDMGNDKTLEPSGVSANGEKPRITVRDLTMYLRVRKEKESGALSVATKSGKEADDSGDKDPEDGDSKDAPVSLANPPTKWPELKAFAADHGIKAKKKEQILAEIAELAKAEADGDKDPEDEADKGDGADGPVSPVA